jgi:hypothetical protein
MQSRGRLAKFVAVAFIVLGFLAVSISSATFELPRKLLVFEGGEYQIKYSMPVTMERRPSENLIVTVEDDNEPRGVKIKIGERTPRGKTSILTQSFSD